MKKTIIQFVCDKCGAPMPEGFIGEAPNGESCYDLEQYNRITDCGDPYDHEHHRYYQLDLYYARGYQDPYHELCPKCRLEMLKQIVSKLEEQEKENYQQ